MINEDSKYNKLALFEEEFKTIKERVEIILKYNGHSRGCDVTLCMLYWIKYEDYIPFMDGIKGVYKDYSDLFNLKGKLTPPESISRARRVLQYNEGLYKPDDATMVERMEREVTVREFMVKTKGSA